MSGGGGDTTTVQKSDPWMGAQPYLMEIFNKSALLSKDRNAAEYYPGQTVTPFSNPSLNAMDQITAYSKTDPSYSRSGLDMLQKTANGDFLDSNPYLDSILNKSMDQTNAMFQGGGRYGSAGHAGAMASNLGNIRYQNYANERQNMMDAGKFLPMGQTMFDQSQLGRYNAGLGVGGMLEGKQDQYNQDALTRWNFAQNEPWDRLMKYASIISPGAGIGGSSMGSASAPGGSNVAGALGGGLAGAQLGSMFGPWGTAIGAGVGLLGGYL